MTDPDPKDQPGSVRSIVLARSTNLATADVAERFVRRVFIGGTVSIEALQQPNEAPVATVPDSSCATAFRLLARQVEHSPHGRRLAITSPGKQEGKSFCALNLALALAASSNAPVMLIEANLQRPTLANRIGFTPPRCIAQWMSSAAKGSAMPLRVVEVCYSNLHVLAVDSQRTEPSNLIAQGFVAAMQLLSFLPYRHIVVDSPAVAGSVDAALIADLVDGVLLCAVKGRTKRTEVGAAVKQLEPIPILGKVLLEV